ncbi:MAG: formylglycine-generating enzyme family protein [Deltaproteobacteria bacterium]
MKAPVPVRPIVPAASAVAMAVTLLCALPAHGQRVAPVRGPDGGAPAAVPVDMRPIPGGEFRPFYRPPAGITVRVRPFLLDVHPVTNADFAAFVVAVPRWQRSHVARVFADEGYLARWASDVDSGPRAGARQPVVEASWFAASAYCRWRGRRLPTEYEWEMAARAGFDRPDASRDPDFTRRLLAWYSHPQPDSFPDVMTERANFWGVYDMHRLVWEWVQDFSPPTVSSDSRQSADSEASRFCGGAALTSADQSDYAAFIRHAMRYSLRGTYAVPNLGFRCASDRGD